ncbi:ATPase with chaperone activity [Hydrogenophaga sp. OTU3427]|uniref:ATPase with chaperone activity n=1 Tax=Hydrogenophaga sp. OTU3427 TaxID=3043856 RepID=UPI00313ED717
MSEDSQILIPPSFIALYVPEGRIKPTLPRDEIAQRYELCEDMAQMLTDTASTMLVTLGITENDVLQRCRQGLLTEPAVVSAAEAGWVVSRLAELMNWPA